MAIMALNIMNNALNQFGARHYFHTFTRKTPGILRPSLRFVKGLNRAATVKTWVSGRFSRRHDCIVKFQKDDASTGTYSRRIRRVFNRQEAARQR